MKLAIAILVLSGLCFAQGTHIVVGNLNNIIFADQLPGSTPDIQLNLAISQAGYNVGAVSGGAVIVYECKPGTNLAAFTGTVLINKPVTLILGGCGWFGPSSGPMFEGAISGFTIQGTGKFRTVLYSNSNTDMIHVDAGFGDWTVSDLDFRDNLTVGARTAGAAVGNTAPTPPTADLNASIHDLLVTGYFNCIKLTGLNDSTVKDSRCQQAKDNHFWFLSGNTVVCINCYASIVLNGAAGMRFDGMNASGVVGGQTTGSQGNGIISVGTNSIPNTGFYVNGTDVEVQTPLVGTFDGIKLVDTSGWVINGGDTVNQSGSGVRCLGGGGGVINSETIGNNTQYGIDASGTSPLGNSCAGITVSAASWSPTNTIANLNDPNGAVAGNINPGAVTYGANNWAARHFVQSGTIADAAGTCTLNNASPSVCPTVTFTSPYITAAPVCTATWTGTGTLTGILKAVTTKTTLIVSDSANTETGVIGYHCIGNPN